MPLHLYISNNTSRNDYIQYLETGSLRVQDQINTPTLCTFNLDNINPQFAPPQIYNYVELYSDKTQSNIFTGVISVQPEVQPLGVRPLTGYSPYMLRYVCQCTSDEYLLNNKVLAGFVPPFVGLTEGQIIQQLTELLAPGIFDVTSHVASGDIVPYYLYNPSNSWSTIVEQFANQSLMRYKVINKTVYFQPYGDAPLSVQYDETAGEATFYPYALTTGLVSTPIVNDCYVIGATEGGSYVQDLWIGDGFTGTFLLSNPAFETSTNLLFQENWQGSEINTQNWTVSDPQNVFSLFQGSLNVLGGTGVLGPEYVLAQSGIQLGGSLYIQHGDVTFTGPGTGIIGGIYSGLDAHDNLTFKNCLLGFYVTPASGALASGNVLITPVVDGAAPSATPVVANFSAQFPDTYQLATQIYASQLFRYIQAYRSILGTAYGGLFLSATCSVSFWVYDTSPFAPFQPTVTQWQFDNITLPAFALYAVVNSQNLQCSLSTTLIGNPPQAQLFETALSASPQQYVRLTDLVQSQATVVAVQTYNGGMPIARPALLEYSTTSLGLPYNHHTWPRFAPTAWSYMTVWQPSYLLTLPSQQQSVGLPPINGVSIVYPPYLTPPLPGQQVAVTVPSVSGVNFDLNAEAAWLVGQLAVNGGLSYQWVGTASFAYASIVHDTSTAMQFQTADLVYGQIPVNNQTSVLPNPPAIGPQVLRQKQIPFISIAQKPGFSTVLGNFGNLPAPLNQYVIWVFNATNQFYYSGQATITSSQVTDGLVSGTWEFLSPGLGSVVAFVVASAPPPSVGQGIGNDVELFYTVYADTNSTPSPIALEDYSVSFFSNGALQQSNVPLILDPETDTLSAMANVSFTPPAKSTLAAQVIYTNPVTGKTFAIFDSRMEPEIPGMVASYQVPIGASASWVPADQIAMGEYSIQNRSYIYDNALAILSYLLQPTNVSQVSQVQQDIGNQAIAQRTAQALANLASTNAFVLEEILENAQEASPSTNWILQSGSGTANIVGDLTFPVNPSLVVDFTQTVPSVWQYVGHSPINSAANEVTWAQRTPQADSDWSVTWQIQTTTGLLKNIKFVQGTGNPYVSAYDVNGEPVTVTVPYAFANLTWSILVFDLQAIWNPFADSIIGSFSTIQYLYLQASEPFSIGNIFLGVRIPGALNVSYDIYNGVPDQFTTRNFDIAWAAYALAVYYAQTGDPVVENPLLQILTYLASQQMKLPNFVNDNLITLGTAYFQHIPTNLLPNGGWIIEPFQNQTSLVVDNLIAYFTFSWAAYVLKNPTLTYTNVFTLSEMSVDCQTLANQIATQLKSKFWIPNDAVTGGGRFTNGNIFSAAVDYSVSLTAQTYGALFWMSQGDFTKAQDCLDFIFAYQYQGTALLKTSQQINPTSFPASAYNESYIQLHNFDGCAQTANDPRTNIFAGYPQDVWMEGTWQCIAALAQYFQAIQFPYNRTNVPLEQLIEGPRLQQVLAFGQWGQTATLSSGSNNTTELQFYTDDIPPLGTLIECRYRRSQLAIAHVRDSENIALQKANSGIAGDNGIRGTVLTNLSPLPESSVQAEAAAQAKITDSENPNYQGSYTVNSLWRGHWNPQQGYPVTGRFLTVNAPPRSISSVNFLVQSVTTTVVEPASEVLTFQINFGQNTKLSNVLSRYILPTTLYLPQDTAQSPLP
ncbi:MAG: hypothetical protein KGN01_07555, partial [Patescibacteria group bacterium]|nr:hypothetical protein [Patescibacteria group bacterium]